MRGGASAKHGDDAKTCRTARQGSADTPAACEYSLPLQRQAAARRRACGRSAEGIVIMFGTNSLIVILVVGLVAGWLAGQIMRGAGYGIIGDIIIGIIGAFIGTWLWGQLHLPTIGNFWINAIVISTIGALVLLLILRLIRR
jgi:uncharacterized membrane protein YeaQ/YmgE (transglycosylase-associated protein family)